VKSTDGKLKLVAKVCAMSVTQEPFAINMKTPGREICAHGQLRFPAKPRQLTVEVIDLGIIRGKACERSCDVVRVEFPIEYRLNMRAEVSDEYNCLSVQEIRGNGGLADVILLIDSRRSGDKPFHLKLEGTCDYFVEGNGRMIIERPTPYILGMSTICGGSSSSSCPIMEAILKDEKYTAFWEPKMKEFWLSAVRGIIPKGSKEFPFKVFFAPKDPRPINNLLVVELEDREITVKVCGSIGGFEGRRWGERKHV
jgi:hypothetical protein